jgi:hypothetical protein
MPRPRAEPEVLFDGLRSDKGMEEENWKEK